MVVVESGQREKSRSTRADDRSRAKTCSMLDAFVHIDAEKTTYVYDWRLQQEAALRTAKGTGMTDEQVINFVNGCKSLLP